MASYWLEEPAPVLAGPVYRGDVDVAVVGAGVTGCSCALALARGGLRVRVHDAGTVAAGASGRNGGFALRGGAMGYAVARRELGPEGARALWELSERALDAMAEIAGDGLRRVGSFRLAVDEEELAAIRSEYEALVADGFAAGWEDDPPGAPTGLFAGALLHPADGALQPARWVRRLAVAAAAAGAEIREHDPVRDASPAALGAEHVVVATDGYTLGVLPELAPLLRPTRGQVLVTEPLPEMRYPMPYYSRWGYDYWHQQPDGRLVLGGRRDTGGEAEFTDVLETTAGVQGQLDRLAQELMGRPVDVVRRWAGIWSTTPDTLPFAGRVPDRERTWCAVGYSGHGNVLGFACGELIAAAILGGEPPELELFDPARFAS